VTPLPETWAKFWLGETIYGGLMFHGCNLAKKMVEKGRLVEKNHGNYGCLKAKALYPPVIKFGNGRAPKNEDLNLRNAFKFGELFVACLITGG